MPGLLIYKELIINKGPICIDLVEFAVGSCDLVAEQRIFCGLLTVVLFSLCLRLSRQVCLSSYLLPFASPRLEPSRLDQHVPPCNLERKKNWSMIAYHCIRIGTDLSRETCCPQNIRNRYTRGMEKVLRSPKVERHLWNANLKYI